MKNVLFPNSMESNFTLTTLLFETSSFLSQVVSDRIFALSFKKVRFFVSTLRNRQDCHVCTKEKENRTDSGLYQNGVRHIIWQPLFKKYLL